MEEQRRWLAFDLEISRPFPEDRNSLDYGKLGISCAAYCTSDGMEKVYHSEFVHPETGMYHDRMSIGECREMLEGIERLHKAGFQVVTWNGDFDFRVLGEECVSPVYYNRARMLARQRLDPMVQFAWKARFPVGLEATASYMIGKQKEGMHGEDAPKLWRLDKESQSKVLKYVLGDVHLTLDVAQKIDLDGALYWYTKAGNISYRNIGKLQVMFDIIQETPAPVPHWMDHPFDLHAMTGWLLEESENVTH